jgi:hypothetical protein
VSVIEDDVRLDRPLSAADILYNFRTYSGNLASVLGEQVRSADPTPEIVGGYEYFRGSLETAEMLLSELDRLGAVRFV